MTRLNFEFNTLEANIIYLQGIKSVMKQTNSHNEVILNQNFNDKIVTCYLQRNNPNVSLLEKKCFSKMLPVKLGDHTF